MNTDLLEFHRYAYALLPSPDDQTPGVAFFVKPPGKDTTFRFCTCEEQEHGTCRHIHDLMAAYKAFTSPGRGTSPENEFKASLWYRLASVMSDDPGPAADQILTREVMRGDTPVITASGPDGSELLTCFSHKVDASRLLERFGHHTAPLRGEILDKLMLLTLSEQERLMSERGYKTRRQVFEQSFWYRIAYHGYREFGPAGCTFHPAIEEASGRFTVSCRLGGDATVLRLNIPGDRVKRLLSEFGSHLANQHDFAIHPIPLKSVFKVTEDTALDLELHPMIRMLQENGEEALFAGEDLARYRYGTLVYLKDLGLMAELESEHRTRRFRAPVKMVLKKSQVPAFLEAHGEELTSAGRLLDGHSRSLAIFGEPDRIEIPPDALDHPWTWLSVRYGFGAAAVSLDEILTARREGLRFIGVAGGWVDCQARSMEGLDLLDRPFEAPEGTGRTRSLMELLRLRAVSRLPVTVAGAAHPEGHLESVLELKPTGPPVPLEGMTAPLRPYQQTGVEWLRFLHEHGFGGLLCDDMGLGKTHQVMALMLIIAGDRPAGTPFLVVCPTTVLSHWSEKIRRFAPGLEAMIYHGGARDLEESLAGSRVLITSYGVLRRDIEALEAVGFRLAVFDEIQQVKNSATLAYRAAQRIDAGMKLGLTGTPVENSVTDIKALMDLTVPGYMGSDEAFARRYRERPDHGGDDSVREELRRLISPFTLRRLKSTVLTELPEKIEDIRSCFLSEEQVRLYRDAVETRAGGILDTLNDRGSPVPYMHIFALLTLLKQICNHPAMLDGSAEHYKRHSSGKWDLFEELLAESLESGQKVVVYSQYVTMVDIITRHLAGLGVDHVSLTGASRNRGRLIARFNEEPSCRVFVGSLKAGGTGIDLVAASVVIHYDRWWNAAREDQATDRVHRIGQTRGVQVFKPVTVGTLEEKIAAIIDRKRRLMEEVVGEDDPGLFKTFTREELMELIAPPSSF